MAAMPRFDEPCLADRRPVRIQPRQSVRAFTVLRLQDAQGRAPAGRRCGASTAARQDSVALVLCRSIRRGDVVCELGEGGFACLMNGAPAGERLYLLAWRLMDALRPAAGAGPTIGAAIGSTSCATYRQLIQQATAAMHRARWQQSGFALYDRHLDC